MCERGVGSCGGCTVVVWWLCKGELLAGCKRAGLSCYDYMGCVVGSALLVLTVIYTNRGSHKRIISARPASKAERLRYMSFIH